LAALSKHVETARLLLDHGAEINGTNNNGMTPLHYAAESDSVLMVQLFLDRGADVIAKNVKG
jgi:ankyrin repeat protein